MKTYSQMHRTNKYSQHSSTIWPVWLNGSVFVHELSGCGLESRCNHLNFRYCACFQQKVPWHSGNYRVWIYYETRTSHCSQMHRADKYSKHSPTIWSVWLNGWVLIYELSRCGFESSCSHLNFRYPACFEQGIPIRLYPQFVSAVYLLVDPAGFSYHHQWVSLPLLWKHTSRSFF